MIRFASLASGSSGNCAVVGYGEVNILIDAGISAKRIRDGLMDLDISMDTVQGIFITHEHSDHTKGLTTLVKKNPLEIYATGGTMKALYANELKDYDESHFHILQPMERVTIGEMSVLAYPSFHDTNEPCFYRVDTPEGAVAVVTDLGHTTPEMAQALQGLRGIILEANHDIGMLETGPYPFPLKRRVMGDLGHLSNEACGRFLCDIVSDDLEAIALGHLSKENNFPDLAVISVKNEINFAPIDYVAEDLNIFVCHRDSITRVLWKS